MFSVCVCVCVADVFMTSAHLCKLLYVQRKVNKDVLSPWIPGWNTEHSSCLRRGKWWKRVQYHTQCSDVTQPTQKKQAHFFNKMENVLKLSNKPSLIWSHWRRYRGVIAVVEHLWRSQEATVSVPLYPAKACNPLLFSPISVFIVL